MHTQLNAQSLIQTHISYIHKYKHIHSSTDTYIHTYKYNYILTHIYIHINSYKHMETYTQANKHLCTITDTFHTRTHTRR
jgi:hypothetical protein